MVKISYFNHWTYPRSEAERSLCFACPTAYMSSHLRSSFFWCSCTVQEPRWNLWTNWANTQIRTVPFQFCGPMSNSFLPPEIGRRTETDSINMATHQQPNRRHIPFEMHRARPVQVNLSFTETRWETCNNNDNTSLTSLLPGLSGTFKIDNLIIYSPPGERKHLRTCGHVVETFSEGQRGPGEGTWNMKSRSECAENDPQSSWRKHIYIQ